MRKKKNQTYKQFPDCMLIAKVLDRRLGKRRGEKEKCFQVPRGRKAITYTLFTTFERVLEKLKIVLKGQASPRPQFPSILDDKT